MPIIKPLSENEVTEEVRTVFEKSKKGSGSSNMVQTYAHNPEMMQAFLQYYGALWKGKIDPVLKEMIRYRVAIAGECDYWQNARIAWVKRLGVTEDILKKVEDYENANLTELENLCLSLADKMATNNIEGKDALFSKLKEYFTDSELIELTMCISFFVGVGRMNRFLDIDF